MTLVVNIAAASDEGSAAIDCELPVADVSGRCASLAMLANSDGSPINRWAVWVLLRYVNNCQLAVVLSCTHTYVVGNGCGCGSCKREQATPINYSWSSNLSRVAGNIWMEMLQDSDDVSNPQGSKYAQARGRM